MKCPICSKNNLEEFKPFCSERCADIDLSRWASETYVVPGVAIDDSDDEITD
jgi:endogenous inhibitor of DNA gyrase (YacG/DUF329 family)